MFLLIVETAVERLGCVCELFPCIGPVDLLIGIFTQFVDQIDADWLLYLARSERCLLLRRSRSPLNVSNSIQSSL